MLTNVYQRVVFIHFWSSVMFCCFVALLTRVLRCGNCQRVSISLQLFEHFQKQTLVTFRSMLLFVDVWWTGVYFLQDAQMNLKQNVYCGELMTGILLWKYGILRNTTRKQRKTEKSEIKYFVFVSCTSPSLPKDSCQQDRTVQTTSAELRHF